MIEDPYVAAHLDRARAVKARATRADPPHPGPRPAGEPAALSAIYAIANGLEFSDGTRILGRDAIARATAWLVEERSLSWDSALAVIGERDDLVLVLDPRASGGVLESATDGLSVLRRAARSPLGYLEARLGVEGGEPPAPERAAKIAIEKGDAEALAAAIEEGFYPGSDRDLAHASLALGGLYAARGDEARAMEAFARSVEARLRAVPRGASEERGAAWRAAAMVADKAGNKPIAGACLTRSYHG